MLKTILIMALVLLLTACDTKDNKPSPEPTAVPSETAKPTPTPTKDPEAEKREFLEPLVGDHVSTEFLHKFKETRSVAESASGYCILKLEDFEDKYSFIAANVDEGILLGEVSRIQKQNDGQYIITTAGFDGNGAKLLYSGTENKLVCEMRIKDYEEGGFETSTVEYTTFGTEEGEDADSYFTRILFENCKDVEIKGKRVYATVDGARCRLKLKICAGDVTASHPSYSGAITIIPADGSEPYSGLYMYKDGSVIVTDMNENVLGCYN